jgi:pilus assembly protein CpaD
MSLGTKDYLRLVSLVAVLAAGSCSSPFGGPDGLMDDPAVNHPIQVEPNFHSLKLAFSAPNAGLMPDDSQHFDAFVADFIAHGNGAISITVPSGPDANAAIAYFGERMASAGVPRDRILVGTRDRVGADGRVELGYISYQASTGACGDWSSNLAYTASNRINPNMGCAVQHNVAAQVADPRDLIAPRDMTPGDAARRAVVYDNYKNGKPTGATLTPDQSAAVSDVNK